MQQHEFTQGSPEWHRHRASHFNASDAPAMLGISPYKSRTRLLDESSTGIMADVDVETQCRFDEGHRIEALARPRAESVIGLMLYAVTGSDGNLSASFDGLTASETICWEHKTLNNSIRASLDNNDDAANLPEHYRAQMEQQLMVSGAEKCLFTATSWDENTFLEERIGWYVSDPELRQRVIHGWEQFAVDLETHQHVVSEIEPMGRAPDSLPALRIEIIGMVTASNLAEYKAHALAVIGGINNELKTDEEFANADKTVKWCCDVEDRIDAVKLHALSQTASIENLFRTMDDIKAEVRSTRLELSGLIKVRKETIRLEIRQEAVDKFAAHIITLNDRLGKPYMPVIQANFGVVMKSKKSVASLQEAVNTELARVKIEANAIADKIEINLNSLSELAVNYAFLFADTAQIVLKQNDDLAALIKIRIAEHNSCELAAGDAVAVAPEIAAEVQPQAPAVVAVAAVSHEHVCTDAISAFLKTRSFAEENKVRAILVEFVKFQSAFKK